MAGLVIAELVEPVPRIVFFDADGRAVVWCACGCDTWLHAPKWSSGWRIYADGHGPEYLNYMEARGRRFER